MPSQPRIAYNRLKLAKGINSRKWFSLAQNRLKMAREGMIYWWQGSPITGKAIYSIYLSWDRFTNSRLSKPTYLGDRPRLAREAKLIRQTLIQQGFWEFKNFFQKTLDRTELTIYYKYIRLKKQENSNESPSIHRQYKW